MRRWHGRSTRDLASRRQQDDGRSEYLADPAVVLVGIGIAGSGEVVPESVVISSPDPGVIAVAAAGVLCAFPCVVDALPAHCLRRRSGSDLLVAAIFRTKWLLRELCSVTCLRRRRPGQVRRRQGRLQITADLRGCGTVSAPRLRQAERVDLGRPLGGPITLHVPWLVNSERVALPGIPLGGGSPRG